MAGASAGALVAAYYAALGDPLPVLIEDAARTTLTRLLAFALHLRRLPVFGTGTLEHCRRLHARLEALDGVAFDALRGPVGRLGVLAFDWTRMAGFFACTGSPGTGPLSVGRVVRGSASIPVLFPPVLVNDGRRNRLLSDGGLIRSLPLEWVFAPPLSATHALAVQLPTLRRHIDAFLPARRRFLDDHGDRIVVVTPRLGLVRRALRGRRGLEEVFRLGREALDDDRIARLRRWQDHPPPVRHGSATVPREW